MIRINLLPFRAARRKENIRRQVSVFLLLVLFAIVSLAYYNIYLGDKIKKVEHQNDAIEKEIVIYKKKANRVEEIKKTLAILEKKVDIIESLKKQRKKPLEIVDSMTRLIVAERMWLNTLDIDEKKVAITGIAFDNKTVADFMENLGASDLFKDVDLNNMKRTKIANDIQMKSFQLVCLRSDYKEPPPQQPKKKGKRRRRRKR